MPLTPRDVVEKKFREAFRGYNQDDVDLFLDEVVEEFTRLSEENQKMKVRLAALQQEIARLREGRGGAMPPASASASAPAQERAARPDPAEVEAEVRARLRRFFEDQLRGLDSGVSLSPTAQRIARELPGDRPAERSSERPAEREPERPVERAEPRTPGRDPFWGGD